MVKTAPATMPEQRERQDDVEERVQLARAQVAARLYVMVVDEAHDQEDGGTPSSESRARASRNGRQIPRTAIHSMGSLMMPSSMSTGIDDAVLAQDGAPDDRARRGVEEERDGQQRDDDRFGHLRLTGLGEPEREGGRRSGTRPLSSRARRGACGPPRSSGRSRSASSRF